MTIADAGNSTEPGAARFDAKDLDGMVALAEPGSPEDDRTEEHGTDADLDDAWNAQDWDTFDKRVRRQHRSVHQGRTATS